MDNIKNFATAGVAQVGVSGHNLKMSTEFTKNLISEIKKIGLKIAGDGQPLLSDGDIENARSVFKKEDVDILIIVNGTWAPDQFSVRLASLEVPIIFWSIPEPLTGNFVELASLVGLSQNGATLSRMGYKLEIVVGDYNDAEGLEKIKSIAKAANTSKKINNTRVGLIGSGCPGMLDTDFDELNLKKKLGAEVIKISINSFLSYFNEIKEADVSEELISSGLKLAIRSDENSSSLFQSTKVFFALKKLVEEQKLNCLAFRCWPELKELGIVSPCMALSFLNSMGISASCEGDLFAAISMQVLNNLSGNPAYLGDLMRLEEDAKTIFYFHCGAAALEFAAPDSVCYKTHSFTANWNSGITVEFPVKPGILTFARIDQLLDGEHRLITYSGEAVNCNMVCRGNPMKVTFTGSPYQIIKKLVNSGAGHHQLCTYGNFRNELRYFADIMKMQFIEADR